MANGDGPISTMDIICAAVKSDETKSSDENIMVVQVCVKVSLVDNVHPFVEIFVRPRALLQNKLPITMMVRTSAEFTFAAPDVSKEDYFKDEAEKRTITTHSLKPNAAIEIYSQDSSIPISIRCGDAPVSGTETDWCKGWIDVPLGRSRLASHVHCLLPFKKGKGQSSGGIEFLICEDEDVVSFQSFSDPTSSQSRSQSVRFPLIRTVNFALSNFAVDHTGAMLFELETVKGNRSGFCPFPAFSCPRVHRRITLLPTSDIVKLRMVKLSIQAHEGFKRSIPFCVDDISICEGGIQSSAIYWENNKPSGFFAYRRPSIGNQWEVHFVPEFVLFNGGKHTIIVQKMNAFHVKIKPHKMSHFYGAQLEGLIVSVIIPDVHGETKGIQVDSLGTRIRVVRSIDNGRPIGSLAVQTVVGAQDSRLVIKVGEVRFGGLRKTEFEKGGSSIIANDFLRLRIRWSLLEVTLHDTERLMFSSPLDTESSTAPRKIDKVRAASIGRICSKRMESHVSSREFDVRGDKALISSRSLRKCKPVAQVKFFQVTIDFQRIFKDRDMNDSSSLTNDERSQFSIIVHQAVLLDCTSEEEQVVFESASSASFIDLCLRFKGSLNADLIKVDLLSLNLAHFNGKSESIVISTSESFVWRLVDVAYRIVVTISELTGVHSKHGISEHIIPKGETEEPASSNTSENDAVYTPPQSDKLFDVKVAVVSPVKLIVSFKRQPHSSRYQLIKDVKFARLVNYFVSKLNFTVDQASISFSGYRTSDVKGPPSRLLEELRAVYVSRLKYQLITLITSVSIQEWKTLTARTEGAESYVEGDVLRMTGHIIGRSAGYMFKKFGEGIGDSLTAVTGSLGENVEKSASLIGLGVVGGAVNSVVSGLGDGVSSTVKGVGSGASKVVKGAGKGVGQIAGGVEGGVTLFAKGIKKGICHGDGDAVVSGFSDGAASMISGVGQGLESAFVGATEGVVNVGQGLFHGIGSVGMGIGNALMGKPSKKVSSKKDIRRR
jgi:vacuolar protein sorting-associated protein 13A/C